jgi:hypothetical protein
MLGMATPPRPNMEPFWNHRNGLASFCQMPNAQTELRGLTISRRAAVSSSLWLDRLVMIYNCHLHAKTAKLQRTDCPLTFTRFELQNRS